MKRILEVQKQIGVLGKDSENPFFESKYLDLNKLLIHITPLLHDNGLMLIQPITNGFVTSKILDNDTGDIVAESAIELAPNPNPQKLGSAITYFRRYTLKSLLAIAEGDDDGHLAAKPNKTPTIDEVIIMLDNCKFRKDVKDLSVLVKSYDLGELANNKYQTLNK